MPVSVVLAPVVALPATRLEPVRLVMSGRGCPACGGSYCFAPAECLSDLMSRAWGDCDWCEGFGWAGDDSLSVFCEGCGGSGLEEHDPGSLPRLGAAASARLAAHIDRLRALVGVAA
ncbi:hypothetical protein [Actinacidiphila sp. ITFR-21]|uniref:hypothetical protein n=1 Tax=Actinacidiphila sp. ITFR-21 TaxID=3075199 RepID=UPI00288C4126|nr:hypothetical protein [Streptomyces sp. ITFR-21]WNI18275.1 hypothetical protein RLT57_23870 [Streptomyces sp. ITFR-21]